MDSLVVRGVGERPEVQRPVAERLEEPGHTVQQPAGVRPDPGDGRRRPAGGGARQQRAGRVDEDDAVGEGAREGRFDRRARRPRRWQVRRAFD